MLLTIAQLMTGEEKRIAKIRKRLPASEKVNPIFPQG
jgi:hypothetical protein